MKHWQSVLVLIITTTLVATGTFVWQKNRSEDIELVFTATIDDQPLQFNAPIYDNPNGAGTFKVRDFQFFISNITLTATDSVYTEPESYHLVRFDSESGDYRIRLADVPTAAYGHIAFGIGVDPAANRSIESVGDLDPNGRMAWNWEVGYKFLLFEGGMTIDGAFTPLVYHIGFSENYKTLHFPMPDSDLLAFEVKLMAMFTRTHPVNLAETPNVKFNRVDAEKLAENYQQMIQLLD